MMNYSTSPPTKALIFLVQIVCLVVFLLTSHCSRPTVFFPMDDNLIEQTCNQTPYPDLCVSALQSDPRSPTADVKGLGIIMIYADTAKVRETVDLIDELINDEPGKIPAQDCRNDYNNVIQIALPQATEAFSKGDYKSVELGMVNIVANADSCETGFSGGSPFKDQCKAAHDLMWLQQLPAYCPLDQGRS